MSSAEVADPPDNLSFDFDEEGLKSALKAERQIEPAATSARRGRSCSRKPAPAPAATSTNARPRRCSAKGRWTRRSSSSASSPATRRTSPAGRSSAPPGNCSTGRWTRPASTARRSTSPTRSSISNSSCAARGGSTTSPNAGEIEACKWWIDQERALIRPPVTVALGATAARSLTGKTVTISRVRGAPLTLADGSRMLGDGAPELPAAHPRARPPPRGEVPLPRRPQAHQGAGGGARGLDAEAQRRPHRARGAGRDVVVAVRGREIVGAEDILDIDLRLDPARQLVEGGRRRRGRSRAASPHC